MQLEDEVLGQVLLVAPDDPAWKKIRAVTANMGGQRTDADVGQAKLVSGGVDTDDAGDLEVPEKFGLMIRSDLNARDHEKARPP